MTENVDEVAETDGGDVTREEASFVEYGIEDRPPLRESIFLGMQHYLTMVGASVAVPLILATELGMPGWATAQLVGTFFVVSGISTLAQTTVGNRYPIVQGGTFALLAPAVAIIAATSGGWEASLLELQGAVIMAALVQVFLGYSGLLGRVTKYLSPVVIAPVIVLIGLSLVGTADVTRIDQNWWLLGLTLFLIILFSQYLDSYSRYAKLFPVLLGVASAWIVSGLLTALGIFTEASHVTGPNDTSLGYIDFGEIANATLVQPIVPFQWGMPEFTAAFAIGMLAGIFASILESIGDYYAVARIAGVGAPSQKRINHGIGLEGLSNIFAGIMGTGNGSTSYGENVGAIGITGVASRYVVQIGAVVMLIVGFFGPFGALITTIPSPIVGALYIAMFGQIAAVGLSNLKFVDLDASRNVFIVGIALFLGLALPNYFGQFEGPGTFQSAAESAAIVGPIFARQVVSDTIFVIGSTTMAVGGLIAFVLDNTIEGTREERGLAQWDRLAEDESEFQTVFDRLRSSDDSTVADTAD